MGDLTVTCPWFSMASLICTVVCLSVMRSTATSTTTWSQRIFILEQNTTLGVTRIGPAVSLTSRVLCAHRCMIEYSNNCLSFMYNPLSGLCVPGSSLSTSQPPPSFSEGDLYLSHPCATSKGFILHSYNGTDACIGVFGPPSTYFDADAFCKSKGAFLMSAKIMNKLNILWELNGSDMIWVGCDDTVSEGTYVWKEDGESFTSATIPITFSVNEPNNGNNDQDCVARDTEVGGRLSDFECTERYSFACEMSIV